MDPDEVDLSRSDAADVFDLLLRCVEALLPEDEAAAKEIGKQVISRVRKFDKSQADELGEDLETHLAGDVEEDEDEPLLLGDEDEDR